MKKSVLEETAVLSSYQVGLVYSTYHDTGRYSIRRHVESAFKEVLTDTKIDFKNISNVYEGLSDVQKAYITDRIKLLNINYICTLQGNVYITTREEFLHKNFDHAKSGYTYFKKWYRNKKRSSTIAKKREIEKVRYGDLPDFLL